MKPLSHPLSQPLSQPLSGRPFFDKGGDKGCDKDTKVTPSPMQYGCAASPSKRAHPETAPTAGGRTGVRPSPGAATFGARAAVKHSSAPARSLAAAPGDGRTPGAVSGCAPSKRLLVLGLGNDILSDDAIGLRVAGRLEADLADQPSIDVRRTTEMGLALLDHITGYRAVFIVDAIQTGKAQPGFIHEFDPSSLAQAAGRTPHFLGVGETLALGTTLGLDMPRQVRIFAIEVADPFTLATRMTPALEFALPAIAARISAAARSLAQG